MNKLVILAAIWVLVSLNLNAQSYTGTGIGLRGGEPSGITFKSYQGNSAFEFNVGTTVFWWSDWIERRVMRKALRSRPHPDDELISWGGSYTSIRYGLQAIYQPYFVGISGLGIDGLYWYLGMGAQLNFVKFYWKAYYDHPPYNVYIIADHYRDGSAIDIDVGPVGMVGVEWILAPYGFPFSIALDVAGFVEILDQPLGKLYIIGNGSIRILLDEL